MVIEPSLLMKAKPYNPKTHTNLNGWISETKYDGVSGQIVVNGLNDIKIYSGNVIKKTNTFNDYTAKLPHVVKSMRMALSSVPDIYQTQKYQGEFVIARPKGMSREEAFTYVSGTLNADDALQRQVKQHPIYFICYNIPTMDDQPYGVIIARISALFARRLNIKNNECVCAAAYDIIGEKYDFMELYERSISNGDEGIVIYNPLAKYKHSVKTNVRTNDCIKMKDINECEVKVVSITEGVGKRKNMVGALVCEDGNGRKVNIGSFKNFSDADLINIWNMRDKVPFIVDMAYHSQTEDSYRNPRLVRIRTDKTIEEWNP